MMDTWRVPYAVYSASCTCCGETPRVRALSRLMSTIHLGTGELQVAIHIEQARQAAHLGLNLRRPVIDFLGIRALQRKLVGSARELAADLNGRRVLHESQNAGNARSSLPRIRLMNSSTDSVRWERGFIEMKKMPVLPAWPNPAPVNDIMLSTAGSASRILLSAC